MTTLYFAKLRPDFFENEYNHKYLSAEALETLRSMRNFVIVSFDDFFDTNADYDAELNEFVHHYYSYLPDFVTDADIPDSNVIVKFALMLEDCAFSAYPFLCDPSDIVAQHSIDVPDDLAPIISASAEDYLDYDPHIQIERVRYMTDFMRDLLPVLNSNAQ